MALEKPYTKSKTILEYHKNLNKLCSNNQVTVSWVPGHQGYEGNETADRLAKKWKRTPTNKPCNTQTTTQRDGKKVESIQIKAY